MTAASELAAVRAVARRLGETTRPIEVRSAHAWAANLRHSARNLGRQVEHLRAEVDRRLPAEVDDDPNPYDGLDLAEASARFASRVQRLALTASTHAGDLMAERGRFLAACAALSAPQAPQGARARAGSPATLDEAGKARRGARATSKAAALAVLPKTGNQRRRILDAVAAVARDPRVVGLTDHQLVSATGLSPNSVRPRRGELVEGGWLEAAPTTREHYGSQWQVWCLTQRAAGCAELWAAHPGA